MLNCNKCQISKAHPAIVTESVWQLIVAVITAYCSFMLLTYCLLSAIMLCIAPRDYAPYCPSRLCPRLPCVIMLSIAPLLRGYTFCRVFNQFCGWRDQIESIWWGFKFAWIWIIFNFIVCIHFTKNKVFALCHTLFSTFLENHTILKSWAWKFVCTMCATQPRKNRRTD